MPVNTTRRAILAARRAVLPILAAPTLTWTSDADTLNPVIAVAFIEAPQVGDILEFRLATDSGFSSLVGGPYTDTLDSGEIAGGAVTISGFPTLSLGTSYWADVRILRGVAMSPRSTAVTKTTTAVDTTPNAFTFTDVTGATLSTQYTSNTITVSGINSPAAISITGGTYSVNGGAYTSSSGTVANGDTVAVRVTSSGSNSTASNVVLTIGGVSDTYTVTTAAASSSAADYVFMSGFETGGMQGFSVTGAGHSVQATTVRSGGYALQVGTSSNDPSNVALGSLTTLSARFGLRIGSGTPTENMVFKLRTASGTSWELGLTASRTLAAVQTEAIGLTRQDGATALTANTWYLVEVVYDTAAGGVITLWINGVQEFTTTHTNAGAAIATAQFDIPTVGGYFDDVVVKSTATKPGDGKIIARQWTSATPTHDAFTKSSGSTIDTVWNDTPFSASTNAANATTTAAVAQTAKVASFSSTQSGHGSETLSGSETINAARIGVVAKTSATSSGGNSGAVRRIVNGVTTDDAKTVTTSDAFYASAFFSDTLANLNAAEGGWLKNTSTANRVHTVEDAWMNVDYTP